ncbi:MAG: hypothetical protein B6245_04795 [Desulfobacteraceae bacterium 4572_88]|nr:MAG: hypothetical protein B6245_04795 [Desulfobacteraceae bacterium 4572_88]
MKQARNLFEKICSFDNLMKAARKAFQGKKDRPRVAAFYFHLESEILTLQDELLSGTYQPRPYRSFWVYEPKRRHICAADFRDRVVHHAICNLLEPEFERSFVKDSYACRKHKGSHIAVRRVKSFCRKRRYFLKTDISKYYDSVDHALLKKRLALKIKDPKLLTLINIIIDHPLPDQIPGKGLPIGNLTSQWWANFYLDALDHYIKDDLGVKCYARYMDDVVILADTKPELHLLCAAIRDFLDRKLLLKLKDKGTFVAPVWQGLPFLGFRIYPNLTRLKREKVIRFRRQYRQKENAYLSGKIGEDEFVRSVTSMIGHMKHANTLRMRQKFFWGEG